jgi:hypothetical protein
MAHSAVPHGRSRLRPTVLAVVLCLALGACSHGGGAAPARAAAPVLHGAGTTQNFTTYLSRLNPGFAARVGAGKEVKWYIVHDGQCQAPELAYAPLPESLVPEIEFRLFAVHGPGGGYAGS